MGKPEIIGWTSDPDNWSAPQLPEMTFDSNGVSIPCIGIDDHGDPYETTRYLGEDELDGFMRHHGYKRVYKPRNFRAKRRSDGYSVYCGVCNDSAYTDRHLPHDFAKIHAEKMRHYSTGWS